jgi:hypothetical protein
MLFHFRESPCFSLFYSLKNIENDSTFQGLFKNAQMQGAQKANREAYMDIRRAVRFAA